MSFSRALAACLLRPALAGLALLLLAAGPSVAAAQEDHEGHCASAGQAAAPAHTVQVVAPSTLVTPRHPCGTCPETSCNGPGPCAAGGVVAVEFTTIAVVIPVPSAGIQLPLSGAEPPSFNPTPPTPPPNTSSVC